MTVQDMQNRTGFLIDDNSGNNYSPAQLVASLNVGQDNVAKEFVNLGVGWFERAADLNATNTPPGTIAGQELYLLPSDFIKFIRVERADTGQPLNPININDKLTQSTTNPTQLSNTSSYNYFVTGKFMGINPVPTSPFPVRLWYAYMLPRIADPDDVSEIPANWHDMVCISAAIDFIGKDEGNTAVLERRYSALLMQLHQTESSRQIQSPRGVTQTHDSYGY